MPNLMSVFMSLYEEETVHMVITSLPNLQFLNGIEIQRKEEKAAEAAANVIVDAAVGHAG